MRSSTRRYYDANTRRFLSLGHGSTVKAVRRAVWAPEVTDRTEAIQYVNGRIAGLFSEMEFRKVIDLGCGVGESLMYLESENPRPEYIGITLSGIQKKIGRQLIKERDSRVNIFQGSYLDEGFYQEHTAGTRTLFFMIESLLHCPDTGKLFSLLQRYSQAGDCLVICDDFLKRAPCTYREERLLKEFRRNWHAGTVAATDSLKELVSPAGFDVVTQEDWTEYLELFRPRDRLTRLFLPLIKIIPGSFPWQENLLGGTALQSLLKSGVLGYFFVAARRR